MKKYEFKLIVTEGNDEFWEKATASGKTGCDEALELVRDILGDSSSSLSFSVKLESYFDK
jgi:hypothetical protein